MKIRIEPHHFEEVVKRGYSLDLIYLMILIHKKVDISSLRKNSKRIESLYATLLRKALITTDNELTTTGTDLIIFMNTPATKKLPKRPDGESDFMKWWTAFPSTDKFEHEGYTYAGTRSLKSRKDDCRIMFDKVIIEGKYTVEELIKAVEHEVAMKKAKSVRTGKNQLQFMKNTHAYLYQGAYEGIIEELRSKKYNEPKYQDRYGGSGMIDI